MVPQATSFPLTEKLDCLLRALIFLYAFDACANPTSLGICEAVGEISELEFFCKVKFFQSPLSSML